MIYIYTMEYYSALKKNKIMPFAATWMDPEMSIQRNRNIVWYSLCEESKKKWYKWTDLQNRKTHRLKRIELMVTRGEGWGKGIVREFGTDIYTLLY